MTNSMIGLEICVDVNEHGVFCWFKGPPAIRGIYAGMVPPPANYKGTEKAIAILTRAAVVTWLTLVDSSYSPGPGDMVMQRKAEGAMVEPLASLAK